MTFFGIAGTVATIIFLYALVFPIGLVGVFIAVKPLINMGRTAVNLNGGVVASAVTCKLNRIKLS